MTRETAARRAYECMGEAVPWQELGSDYRERWLRVADAVLATLQYDTDSAITQRLDDLEERLRAIERDK